MNTAAERWKKIVFSLPEQIFFDIIRNYLGEVKTPFNKHSLIDELLLFLKNEKTIERIVSLIDRQDAALLSAVYMTEPVSPKQLYRLFSGHKSYYDFYLHLQNLEERMLLCTWQNSEGESFIIISPVYEKILEDRIIDSSFMFPSAADDNGRKGKKTGWLDDTLLFSILSFLLRQGQVLKLDGNFRKKVTQELMTAFPDQLVSNPDRKIDIIRIALRRLGLVRQEGDYFIPVVEKWKEISEITAEERWLFFSGAVFSKDYAEYGYAVKNIIENLERSGKGYAYEDVSKIVNLCALLNNLIIPDSINDFVQKLIDIELIVKKGDKYFSNNWLSGSNLKDDFDCSSKSVVIQTNFDIHVPGKIPSSAGFLLAVVSDICLFSDVMHYTLSRESYIRALDNGFSSEEIEQFFISYGGYSLPQNVIFSLRSWEKDYKGIEVNAGIVVTADERKRNIIDKSGYFSSRLCRKLAEGVYLVNPENIEPLIEAFSLAGVENLPAAALDRLGKRFRPPEGDGGRERSFYCNPGSEKELGNIRFNFSGSGSSIPEYVKPDNPDVIAQLSKTSISQEQKEVVSDRIRRKIIFFPSQITRGTSRYEKTEAKGLDYNGKIRIAEQITGSSGYLALVMETGSDGNPLKRLIRPEALEKEGSSCYLRGLSLPEESEVRISISRISLIRKIKTSLFMK